MREEEQTRGDTRQSRVPVRMGLCWWLNSLLVRAIAPLCPSLPVSCGVTLTSCRVFSFCVKFLYACFRGCAKLIQHWGTDSLPGTRETWAHDGDERDEDERLGPRCLLDGRRELETGIDTKTNTRQDGTLASGVTHDACPCRAY